MHYWGSIPLQSILAKNGSCHPFVVRCWSVSAEWFICCLIPITHNLAHAHHAWETFNNLGRTRRALTTAIAGSRELFSYTMSYWLSHLGWWLNFVVFQLAYTTLFGWFAAYLFIRTNSAYATCFSHIFCNFMGLPTVGRDVEEHPRFGLSKCTLQ